MSISPSLHCPTTTTPQRSGIPQRRPLIVRALLLGAVLFAAAGAALVSAPAALAHDELVGSTPAAGERLAAPPAELELRFSSALTDLGNQVQVLDAQGRNWAEAGLVLNRESLVQPLPSNMPNGEYSVLWRAVSSDGHPITGSFEFFVGPAATASPGAPASAPESADAADTAATPEATETAEATDTAEATATAEAADASDDGGRPAWLLPGIIGGVTGLVLYAVYTFVSRRRQRQAQQQAQQPSEE